jgi:uncharacterized protein
MEDNNTHNVHNEQNIEHNDIESTLTKFTFDGKLNEAEKTVDINALEAILKYIVTAPENIVILRKVDEMGVLLTLQVDQADMGVVIGRGGEMANSIKKYIKKVGQVNNMNVRLRIEEPVGSTRIFIPKDKTEKQEENSPEKLEQNTNQNTQEKWAQVPQSNSENHDDLQEFSLS